MAICGTISIATYPLVPGATTAIQPAGITAPTFSTPPVRQEQDTLTYTPTTGSAITLRYAPTMMNPGDLISEFRNVGVTDATIDNEGRLYLPSGSTLTGTGSSAAYLGF